MDFYDLKGRIERLLAGFHYTDVSYVPTEAVPYLHPGKAAQVKVGSKHIGVFGELHPLVKDKYEFEDAPVLVAEFDLTSMRAADSGFELQSVPDVPPVLEDIALIVDESIPAAQVDRISGSFMLSQVPFGATIQKAFVYANDWRSGNLTLTLNNFGLPGPSTFTDTSSVLTLTSYRWDVTTFLQMQPVLPYAFNIQSSNSMSTISGAALFVVWQDQSAPLSVVEIVDGARIVGETAGMVDTETATFSTLPVGLTSLSLFTVSDESSHKFDQPVCFYGILYNQ